MVSTNLEQKVRNFDLPRALADFIIKISLNLNL